MRHFPTGNGLSSPCGGQCAPLHWLYPSFFLVSRLYLLQPQSCKCCINILDIIVSVRQFCQLVL